jgi:hypothetical protein
MEMVMEVNKFNANTLLKQTVDTALSQKRREKTSERILRARAQREESVKSSSSNTKGKTMGLGIKIAIAAILFSVISGGYFYIEALQGKLEAAAEVQQRLEGVINQQKLVMERNAADLRKMQTINAEVAEKAGKAEREVAALNSKLSKLDEAVVAKAPPTQTEIRINRGTKDALRCNELVTGSPLTTEERTGKIRNGICNDLIKELIAKEKTP